MSSKGIARIIIYGGYLIIAVILLVALSGCQTAPREPCTSFACLKQEARRDFARECVKGFQERARKRPFKVIYPYDDAQWQHEYCRKKARRMFR